MMLQFKIYRVQQINVTYQNILVNIIIHVHFNKLTVYKMRMKQWQQQKRD